LPVFCKTSAHLGEQLRPAGKAEHQRFVFVERRGHQLVESDRVKQASRQHAPDAIFIFVSTNKIYDDRPNDLPFVELKTSIELKMRFELASEYPWAEHGIPEGMSIDGCLRSLFGASKITADMLV
jgi:hypothetical protein